ncbi:MAG TPA: ATP-binding protein [Bacteroidales bacterium]|nr:ATP-binding protein [Bacteroidales bacterium]
MKHHIRKLIESGESQTLDFKFEISDSKKIAKTFVAFANTDGGTLLIGVKDNGSIAGVRSEEEYYMIEAASKMYCKPEVPFQTRRWNIDGKTILELNIPKSSQKPHFALTEDKRWMVYIRVNDQNLLANSILLKVWQQKKEEQPVYLEFTKNEKLLLTYLEDAPYITISKFCKIAMISRKEAESILVKLISINVLKIEFTEKQVFYKLA